MQSDAIVYERLLLGKTVQKSFEICNVGLLPFKWQMEEIELLPKELCVYPTKGDLNARNSVIVVSEMSGYEDVKEIRNDISLQVRQFQSSSV